ncbi:MAG: PilZ domain-containing protein [Desulfobacterales bacterium]|nr:PilZ domain-containing protein [Desulfobacterales bacterium]
MDRKVAHTENATIRKGGFGMNTVELAHGYALEVGTALQVRIEDIDYIFGSEFVGAGENGRVLISTDDAMDLMKDRLKAGMIVSTYYLADDIYHMFNTRFECLADDPRPAMVLEAPKEVLNIERRSQRRINCTLPARVDVRKTLSMEIVNINHKGCRIIADAETVDAVRLEPSDRILLRIRAPQSPHGYIVEGQVRNVQQQGEKVEAGVLFDTLPETLKTYIESLTSVDG